MSHECGECERDLRGGHDVECSRWAHFELEMRNWGEECSPVQCAVVEHGELMEMRKRLARAQAQLAAADRLAEAAQGVKDAPWSIHEHEDLQAYNRAWFNLEQALTAFREVRRG